MPSIATMTDAQPLPSPVEPKPASLKRVPTDQSGSSSGSPFPRRRRRYEPQPTFHLNIGRVEIPRSLPPVRTIGTQTDESAMREQSVEDKKWFNRTLRWGNKWVMPVLRVGASVLGFVLGRVGFGFRLR